jgi:hypothetical protein
MAEILQHKQAATETMASEVASKMTEGLTTFLHTHSLGDATQLDTSDVSGLTVRTHRTNRTQRTNRTFRGTEAGRTMRSEATAWEWGEDTEKTDVGADDFSFDGSNEESVKTEDIAAVPFGEDPIVEFDLSSEVPDSESIDATMEHTSLLTGVSMSDSGKSHRSNRGTRKRGASHRTRTMTATDMSLITFSEGRSLRSQRSRADRRRGNDLCGVGERV